MDQFAGLGLILEVMKRYKKLNKLFTSLFLTAILFQVVPPNLLLATSFPSNMPFHELIEKSDLILVVQPTEIVYEPSNKYLNIPPGGWSRFEVLEVWKGWLEKKNFTIGWGYYNYFSYNEGIYKNSKHLMFLKRGPRKMLFGTITGSSFWPLEKIRFPGLEGRREAIIYEYPADYFTLALTGQVLLRDTVEVEKNNGDRIYRKAILLNELRIYVKGILETLRMK